MSQFDEQSFIKKCEGLADLAISQSGLIYEVYRDRLSGHINDLIHGMSEIDRVTAISIAKEVFDYKTRDEIDEEIRINLENGLCIHGLDPYYCPGGCGG